MASVERSPREQAFQEWRFEHVSLPWNVRHVHGRRHIPYAADELLVVCLLKNAACHIEAFIEHYLALGVKHVVLLDNGSTDDTIAMASRYAPVSIYRTTLPFRHNNRLMRRYLIKRFGRKHHWILCVDSDELFDYPRSDRLPVQGLLRYLRHKSSTAMVCYMLDMFSDQAVGQGAQAHQELKTTYPFYDLSAVRKQEYFSDDPYQVRRFTRHNTLANAAVKRYVGGIRAQVFGLHNVYLIKHPLFFLDGQVQFVHQHFVDYATVADITGVLYHYKFTDDFSRKVEDAVRHEQYAAASYEYKHYYEALQKNPALQLKEPTAQRLTSVNDLIAPEFVHVTQDYEQWVDKWPKE